MLQKILFKKIKTAFYTFLFKPKLFIETTIHYIKSFIVRLLAILYSNKPLRINLIEDIRFEFDFDLDRCIIPRMLYGDYEKQEIKVLKDFLCPGDTFIDVGANIGYLSAIALGCVGKSGQVHSFEPVSRYFERLVKISKINRNYTIITNNCAVGDALGKTKINICKSNHKLGNMGMNSIVSGLIDNDLIEERVDVDVIRLDSYIKKNRLSKIGLIKIDVEGYEFYVLKGLEQFFSLRNSLPPILCEIMPEAYPILGYSINDLFEYMSNYSYLPFHLDNFNTTVFSDKLVKYTNVLFLNNMKQAQYAIQKNDYT